MKKFDLNKLLNKVSDKPPKKKKLSGFVDIISKTKIIKFLSHIDDKIFLCIFNENPNRILKRVMYAFSRIGDGYVWLFFATVFVIMRLPYIYIYIIRTISTVVTCIIIFTYFKNLVNRERPYQKHNKKPMIKAPDRYSFPSGHTMTSFAITISFGTYNLPIFIIFLSVSTLIGISRIYTGVHYTFDVLVSAIIGATIGICSNIIFFLIFNLPIVWFQHII